MNDKIPCGRVRPRLSGYHDEALPAALAESIAAHLAGCAACRGELEAIASVAGLVSQLSVDARPGFEARTAARLAAARAARAPWAARARLAKRLSFFAAAALVAALIGIGPAIIRDAGISGAKVSDDQILYQALVENASGDQEDSR